MMTVYLTRDYLYRPHRKIAIAFRSGTTYRRVITTAAKAIVNAGAGHVIDPSAPGRMPGHVDARQAFKVKRWRRASSGIA